MTVFLSRGVAICNVSVCIFSFIVFLIYVRVNEELRRDSHHPGHPGQTHRQGCKPRR